MSHPVARARADRRVQGRRGRRAPLLGARPGPPRARRRRHRRGPSGLPAATARARRDRAHQLDARRRARAAREQLRRGAGELLHGRPVQGGRRRHRPGCQARARRVRADLRRSLRPRIRRPRGRVPRVRHRAGPVEQGAPAGRLLPVRERHAEDLLHRRPLGARADQPAHLRTGRHPHRALRHSRRAAARHRPRNARHPAGGRRLRRPVVRGPVPLVRHPAADPCGREPGRREPQDQAAGRRGKEPVQLAARLRPPVRRGRRVREGPWPRRQVGVLRRLGRLRRASQLVRHRRPHHQHQRRGLGERVRMAHTRDGLRLGGDTDRHQRG